MDLAYLRYLGICADEPLADAEELASPDSLASDEARVEAVSNYTLLYHENAGDNQEWSRLVNLCSAFDGKASLQSRILLVDAIRLYPGNVCIESAPLGA